MNNRSHYYLNKGATLVIKRDDVFKNKNYMKGVTSVTLHGEAIVSEFPTQEMVNTPALKNVRILGMVREFRGDLLKQLKLKLLDIRVHNNSNIDKISSISDPFVLEDLQIKGVSTTTLPVERRNNVTENWVSLSLLNQVSKAKNLKNLVLDNLYISSFPKEFFRLPKLKYLSLRSNRISNPNVLTNIYKLTNLEELDLSYNRELKTLPVSITKLVKLKTLHVFGIEGFESLPNNIGNMSELVNIGVSHKERINIPNSILKLQNNARVEYAANINRVRNGESKNNRNGTMTIKTYYNRWKFVPIKYINQKIPNNGASNSLSYVNFNVGNTAMRIKNANRSPTYMTVNTFKRLANNRTAQGRNHIYKRRNDVNNIHDVYKLNGNTNVFINPMTTKMVKRSNIDFVKFV